MQKGDIKISPIEYITKKCLCCGTDMKVLPYYANQDFCDRCYIIVCKEVFNKENDNLTAQELKDKIKEKLNVSMY